MALSENLRRQLPPHVVATLTGVAMPSVDEEIQKRLNDEEIRKAIAENFGDVREIRPVDNSIGKGTDVVLTPRSSASSSTEQTPDIKYIKGISCDIRGSLTAPQPITGVAAADAPVAAQPKDDIKAAPEVLAAAQLAAPNPGSSNPSPAKRDINGMGEASEAAAQGNAEAPPAADGDLGVSWRWSAADGDTPGPVNEALEEAIQSMCVQLLFLKPDGNIAKRGSKNKGWSVKIQLNQQPPNAQGKRPWAKDYKATLLPRSEWEAEAEKVIPKYRTDLQGLAREYWEALATHLSDCKALGFFRAVNIGGNRNAYHRDPKHVNILCGVKFPNASMNDISECRKEVAEVVVILGNQLWSFSVKYEGMARGIGEKWSAYYWDGSGKRDEDGANASSSPEW